MSSANVQGSLWSEKADDWAEFQEQTSFPLFAAMLNAALVRGGTNFLDVGCGSGAASMLAARQGASITGIDAAPSLIEIAKSRLPSGDFRVGDMEDLPFDENTFDVVFAANSIQYASDSSAALREFKRVCRPRGYIILGMFGEPDTIDYALVLKAAASTLPEPPAGGGPFAMSFKDRLEALFASAELDILTRQFVNCPFVYPDVDFYLKAAMCSGPVIGVARKAGKEQVEQAILAATQPMITDDGEVRFERNHFQYLVAKK